MTKKILFAVLVPILLQSKPAESAEKNNAYHSIAIKFTKENIGVIKAVAVAAFSYTDGRDSKDGEILAERITTELVKTKKIKVIERKEKEKIFEELKFQYSGAIEGGEVKEIGKMMGADYVIIGTLTELQYNQLELNIRMVDVQSGAVITAYSGIVVKDWIDYYEKVVAKAESEVTDKGNQANTSIEEYKDEDAKTFYDKGVLYSDAYKYSKAIANFSIAVSINPTYWSAYLSRGFAYTYDGDYSKAIEDFTKVLENSEKVAARISLAGLYGIRADCYARNGEYEKALADSDKAVISDPKSASVYHNRGDIYIKKGDPDNALNEYDKELELKPSVDAYLARGYAYSEKKSKLISDTFSAINSNPEKAEYYLQKLYKICGSSVFSNDQDETIANMKSIGMSISQDPSLSKLFQDFATRCEKYEYLTIADYSSAIFASPEDGSLYYNRGDIYLEKELYDLAIQDYNTALKLSPKGVLDFIKEGLARAYFFRANNRFRAFKGEEDELQLSKTKNVAYVIASSKAISDYTEALKLTPGNIDILLERGWRFRVNSEYDKAILDYNTAFKCNSKNRDYLRSIHWGRGKVYAAQGKYKAALDDFNAAISNLTAPAKDSGLQVRIQKDINKVMANGQI